MIETHRDDLTAMLKRLQFIAIGADIWKPSMLSAFPESFTVVLTADEFLAYSDRRKRYASSNFANAIIWLHKQAEKRRKRW